MECHRRLSSCWESFSTCFHTLGRPGTGNKREEKAANVIENAGAVDGEPDSRSKRTQGADKEALYVAQYDYSARTDQDLSFHAGDTLEALDKSAGDWWYARALTGVSANKQGYIPANYVAPVESIDAEP